MSSCKLCGGDAGQLNEAGRHNLCEARASLGLPTPSLGRCCPICKGTGVRPGTGGGVFLAFALGPAAIARSIRAQFPTCSACAGKGVRA